MKTKRILSIISVLLVLGLIAFGCSSSGGDGDEEAGLSQDNSTAAASGVSQGVSGAISGVSLSSFAGANSGALNPKAIVRKASALTGIDLENVRSSRASQTYDCAISGSFTISSTLTKTEITFNNCTSSESKMDGILSIEQPNNTTMTLFLDITMTDFTTNDTMAFDNVTLSLSNIQFSGATLVSATMFMDGKITGTESGVPMYLEYDNFTMNFRTSGGYEYYSISGKLYVECIGGMIELTTVTEMKVSVSGGCPIAGRVKASSGGKTVEVESLSDGSVRIYYNGSPIQTYPNCNDLEGLCSG